MLVKKLKLKIKKGDQVVIIAGKDKGKSGNVKAVYPKALKLIVEGMNISSRHTKPTQAKPQGGKIDKEMPIHYSNVLVVDPKVSLPTRIGYDFSNDGKKIRISKRSKEIIK